MTRIPLTTGAIALALWMLPAAPAQAICGDDGMRATALIMDAPTIDGDLSDWPDGLQVYHIGGTAPATFRVGYSPETDRVYVALEVEDAHNIAGSYWANTDASDIYTWGGTSASCRSRARTTLPVQFAKVPGAGEYNRGCGELCVFATSTGHKAADRRYVEAVWHRDRSGTTTTYEWSVPVYEDIRHEPLNLEPGRQVGFDIIVTDHDGDGQYRWHAWGNPQGQKFLDPRRLATLALSDEEAGSAWDSVAAVASMAGRLGLVCVGLMAVLFGGMTARRKLRDRIGSGRVAQLEQRVTDTQDVLIALSEKYDALEARYVDLAEQVRRDAGDKAS